MFRRLRSLSHVHRGITTVSLSLLAVVMLGASLFQVVHAVAPTQDTWAHQGVSIRAFTPDDFGSDNMNQTLLNLKSTGANEVLLVIPFYQADITACTFFNGSDTPTFTSVESAVAMAHAAGLRAILNFHPEVSPAGTWRTYINATDRQCWFNNYAAEELSYLQSANPDGAIIGTEEHGMFGSTANPTNAASVKALVATLRAGFQGTLSYDAQEAGDQNDLYDVDWSLFNYAGISCYWNLGTNLAASWNAIGTGVLDPLHAKFPNTQFTCSEVGYRSVAGARTQPWSYSMVGAVDTAEQASDYQGILTFLKTRPYMAGIDFWYWSTDPGAWNLGPTEYTSQNKPAQQVMAANFTTTVPVTPVPPTPPPTPTPPVVTPPTPTTPIATYYPSVASIVGAPTGNETAVAGGTYRTYQHGNIYWSAATGAHAIYGPILARYLYLGGPAHYGFPISNQTVAGDKIGQYNNFTNGRSIYWTNATGAHAIYGAIRVNWLAHGGVRSALGYPTTDEFSITGGRQNNFQNGHWIFWNATTHKITIH